MTEPVDDIPVRPPETLESLRNRDWRQPATLRELHRERGWPPADIARFYSVDVRRGRERLKETDLFDPEQTGPPKRGAARVLWEAGLRPDVEVER